MTLPPTLLAVPNVSEGRDRAAIDGDRRGVRRSRGRAPAGHALRPRPSPHGVHAGRRTRARSPTRCWRARGRRWSGSRIGERRTRRPHPHVGAIDVVPVVYLDDGARGAACAEALVVADRIGEELAVPVFLYGALTGDRPARARSCAGAGAARLAQRMRAGELRPDFGPPQAHPGAGATLVAAREPLVAFNLQLAAAGDGRGRPHDRGPDPRGWRRGTARGARDRGASSAVRSRRCR